MSQPTVLIADDDPNFRHALRIRLQALGYRVLECWDGIGVMAKTRSEDVDAYILDHEMPVGHGMAVAENLRAWTEAPIVFVSSHDREQFREAVTTLPETYYLPKPLDNDKLSDLLGKLMPVDLPRTDTLEPQRAIGCVVDFHTP